MRYAVFFILAPLLVASALGVILSRNPIRSALNLVMTLFLLAVTFVFLDAHMVAALQVIVYAGAIMVLFLFVIMLLNLQTEPREEGSVARRIVAWGASGIGLIALVAAVWGMGRTGPVPPDTVPPADFGTTAALSQRLFTHYVLPFEITSVLLLVAIIGAVVLAKRKLD